MAEQAIVQAVMQALRQQGFKVAAEVPNFHRSVDILALNTNGELWAIECKLSDMKKAIAQSKTHLLSADRVFVATMHKNTKETTIDRFRQAGIGLLYVRNDGTVETAFTGNKTFNPWRPSRNRLLERLNSL